MGILPSQTAKNKILEDYVDQLIRTGYNDREIRRSLEQGIVGYQRRVERAAASGIPVHSLRKMIKKGTSLKKLTIRYDWYAKIKDKTLNKYKCKFIV